MSYTAKHPAAFINALAESPKADVLEWLQRTWDEFQDLKVATISKASPEPMPVTSRKVLNALHIAMSALEGCQGGWTGLAERALAKIGEEIPYVVLDELFRRNLPRDSEINAGCNKGLS